MGRKSEAKEKIVDTFRALLWSRGYGSIGVDEICKEAGINKGTLYHFYESKEDIALSVIQKNSAETYFLIEKHLKPLDPNSRILAYYDLVTKAHRMQAKLTKHYPGCIFGKLGIEMGTINENIRIEIEAWFKEMYIFFADAIVEVNPTLKRKEAIDHAQKLMLILEGAFNLAEIHNSILPIKQGRILLEEYLKKILPRFVQNISL